MWFLRSHRSIPGSAGSRSVAETRPRYPGASRFPKRRAICGCAPRGGPVGEVDNGPTIEATTKFTIEATTDSSYYGAEVHLREGGQDYDIMGWNKEQIISDILDQYERHLHFLHLVR